MDIAEQLSDTSSTLKHFHFKPICELNTTNDWINLESLGKPAAIRAQTLNKDLRTLLIKNSIKKLSLHIHIMEGHLTTDNLYALLFLAESLDILELFFYCQQNTIEILQKNTSYFQFKNNITVWYRAIEVLTQNPIMMATSLELELKRYNTLQTVGFSFHRQWFDDVNVSNSYYKMLIGYAWTCLKSGSHEIACLALEKTLKILTLAKQVRELLFMHLQLIRFLSHQYTSVTNEIFPDQFNYLEEDEITNLFFIKAYSATLSRNLNVAETYLNKCHINDTMTISDEASIYQLNLYALFLVLQNKLDDAFSLEKKIQQHIEKNNIDIIGLKYVNFINIARLHKKMKNFNESFSYYEKAYHEIKDGGYTISDHIYYNMNLGSLYEVSEQPNKALFYWLKTAIYWLSCHNPYALAWRPRLILCQEQMTDLLTPLSLEKIHQFLHLKLTMLVSKLNMDMDSRLTQTFDFILDDINDIPLKSCYIAENIILYSGEGMIPDKKNKRSYDESKLSQLVSGIIKIIMKIENHCTTLIIDSRNELIHLNNDEGCLAVSIVAGCKDCYRYGEKINDTNHIIQSFLSNTYVSLSKLIKSIKLINDNTNELRLIYKRSFLNKIINERNEIDLIKNISNKKMICLYELQNQKLTLLNLIKKNVVSVHYT